MMFTIDLQFGAGFRKKRPAEDPRRHWANWNLNGAWMITGGMRLTHIKCVLKERVGCRYNITYDLSIVKHLVGDMYWNQTGVFFADG